MKSNPITGQRRSPASIASPFKSKRAVKIILHFLIALLSLSLGTWTKINGKQKAIQTPRHHCRIQLLSNHLQYLYFLGSFGGWMVEGLQLAMPTCRSFAERDGHEGEFSDHFIKVGIHKNSLQMANISWWYYFSKFTEFFDTFFFVLRKRYDQVSTLHVIHHGIMPFSVW